MLVTRKLFRFDAAHTPDRGIGTESRQHIPGRTHGAVIAVRGDRCGDTCDYFDPTGGMP